MKIFMQVLPFVVVKSFACQRDCFCVSRSCRIYDTLLLSSWPSSSSTVYCIDKEKRDTTKASLLTIILCSIHLTMYFSTQSLLASCRLRCTYNVVEVCCLCYLRSVAVVTVGFSLDGGKVNVTILWFYSTVLVMIERVCLCVLVVVVVYSLVGYGSGNRISIVFCSLFSGPIRF